VQVSTVEPLWGSPWRAKIGRLPCRGR
jgi:hypothetical protein